MTPEKIVCGLYLLPKGGKIVKKAINVLLAGCIVGALVPSLFNGFGSGGIGVEAAPALAFITGAVTNEQGNPLLGATVAVLESNIEKKEVKRVRTDAQGRFVASVDPGAYLLRAAADGFIPRSTHVVLNPSVKTSYDFKLRSKDTLVQKRGDRDDYRWIWWGVPPPAMKYDEGGVGDDEEETEDLPADQTERRGLLARSSLRGMAQFMAVSSNGSAGTAGSDFFGTNFAVAGSLGGNVDMAFIGQRGVGDLAPQRLAAMASVRPSLAHRVQAMIDYDQIGPSRSFNPETLAPPHGPLAAALASDQLDQLTVSATDSWQVLRPLLLIYGFNYSRFMGEVNNRYSILPRLAAQFSPASSWQINAAVTPGSDHRLNSPEGFNSEDIQTQFESESTEVAGGASPVPDRSQRFEFGVEHSFREGETSIEASVFYDLISGHGVGLLTLPLEASPDVQSQLREVVNQIAQMDGDARGGRVMLHHRINNRLSAAAGYSFGRGSKLNNAPISSLSPAQLFKDGFFQVATAKLDLDLSDRTGTRISTVIRLSPSAVVFAIDPFAGRLSVYDPNVNIYVTQELPSFGLPGRWEALVDFRNLLNQSPGVEDGALQLARAGRIVRGGLAFRW